ncbi:hypothetical protein D3C76_1262130 [compost metagenome]
MLFQFSFDPIYSFILHCREQVRISLVKHGRSHPEAFGSYLRIDDTNLKKKRSVCVAEIMEANLLNISLSHKYIHALCNTFWLNISSGGIAADKVIILVYIPILIL